MDTAASQPDSRVQRLDAFRFSPTKIVVLTGCILLAILVAVLALIQAGPAREVASSGSIRPPNRDCKPRPAASSRSGRYTARGDQLGSGSECAVTLASTPTADAAAADVWAPRLGAVRRFCFGTRVRKVVFSAAVTASVLLVAFVTVYFAVLAHPRDDAGDFGGGSGAGSSSNATTQLTPQQQAELEVSNMMATNPAAIYGPVFGTLSGTVAIAAAAIVLACGKVKIKVGNSNTWCDVLTGPRLATIATCLVVILTFIAVPLGLYFGDNQAFWVVVYAMTQSAPNLPMVSAIVLLALGIVALLVLIFVLWRGKHGKKRVGKSLFRQFMYLTNNTRGKFSDGYKKGAAALRIRLVAVAVLTIGYCIGLAYAIARLGDVRTLCAVVAPCSGVAIIVIIVVMFFNRIFVRSDQCKSIVKSCAGKGGDEYFNYGSSSTSD